MQPVLVLNAKTSREEGRKAQLSNIVAAKAVSNIIRTSLGPRAMLKMVLNPMGGIIVTNDGNSILREIDVSHPAAKNMLELSRSQSEEVGDGTTSVIILTGELLSVAEPFIRTNIHPRTIVQAYYKALDDSLEISKELTRTVDIKQKSEIMKIIHNSVGTKFMSKFGENLFDMAYDAVKIVDIEVEGHREIDIKRYVRIEKIPGGEIEDSYLLWGTMLNKDVLHPKMKRRIENPRIILLDVGLEYNKLESQTDVEIKQNQDYETMLRMEEEYIEDMVEKIVKFKPDLVITEKGCSDYAQHHLLKHNITALRRLKKSDSNRIARSVGAKIVSNVDLIKESDVGLKCGLFEVRKIGDEYFAFMDKCKEPQACTLLLRGPNKDIINEIERNVNEAMKAVRNILLEPRVLPGGGAFEMTLSQVLNEKSKTIPGKLQLPYQAVSVALEVIPRTLIQNCGANTVRVLTELRAKHANGKNQNWGIEGELGIIKEMNPENGVWDPYAVKIQTLKTAIESACMLLKIDEIVSGIGSKENQKN
ncbi:t-complex protein 1 subunit gamma [Anaeramoeba ignava]|uniref:T-complex protein 1 subunit gamma n=1 Tax=Anaeramoeba ignava TaxID=1746090 RepID=A0A9Q0RD05_ANAIG|nr:t-complex protein 1 subunit gamma [Anaeramoeba ignava]|eukprot:Anaeramoba_ignava/a350060_164.p1 GENE.a350060_164~~a350060_164.p1  ORF type:complete len:533 (-),score=160.27 a350060_164:201-1799(-)